MKREPNPLPNMRTHTVRTWKNCTKCSRIIVKFNGDSTERYRTEEGVPHGDNCKLPRIVNPPVRRPRVPREESLSLF